MKISISSWLLLLLVSCGYAGDVYKILVVSPMPGKSHSILGDGVVRHLAAAGHEVTYITAILNKNFPNVRQIDVSGNFAAMESFQEMLSIEALMEKRVQMGLADLMATLQMVHNLTYTNPNVQKLMADPQERFDLVIVEWMFTEVNAGFAAVFNAPFAWVSTIEPHGMVTSLIDENLNPAYSAESMSSSVPPFTFYERIESLLMQIGGRAYRYFVANKRDEELYEKSFGKYVRMRGRELPPLEQIKYNASLMLGNSHVSMGQATTLPQNYKSIGGYHIDTKLEPLSGDLKKILDNAKHGLIYFSMGSNLKSRDMPVELKRDLLKMFGTLKQTVLWKFEEVFPELPSNVHIISWAPQPSILAHPNCVLFITHGGLLSTTETIHFGKPIIGIPVFADQFVNVDRAVKKGFAKRVDLSYGMAADLKVAIEEVLQNSVYAKRVRELSFIYHDRPVPPGAELVHWVEHVIKTGGAPHLRSPSIDMPTCQKYYLDLIALIVVVLYLLRATFRILFRKKSKKQKIN